VGGIEIISLPKNVKYFLQELKELGIVGSIYRVLYEVNLSSGFVVIKDSIIKKTRLEYRLPITLSTWVNFKKQLFDIRIFSPIKNALNNLPTKEKTKIIDVANQNINGKISCFSHWFADYGNPINWHSNPIKKIEWPKDLHWSKALHYSRGGDVKLVWEVNRFPQIYYFVRAYHLTSDPKYIKGFIGQVKDWAKSNPYPKGVNWASGQELAIRVLAWIFALYSFSDAGIIEEDDFELLLKLIYLHAYHIHKNIHYAYFAVHNNHLIAEALALYAIGTLFPFFSHASKWKKRGRKILEGKALEQFYPDGGYCQLSHTYHRLALHYYLWALRIAEVNNEPFYQKAYDILKNSSHFLFQNMNLRDGKLPNWGNNDGALMNPWTNCDFSDFRPVISAVYAVTDNKKVFKSGPWDEEMLWFLGHLPKERTKFIQKSCSFKWSGLHIIRKSPQDFIVMRCGTPPDRFGQADQLHIDIVLDGENIFPDGGSYLYNDVLQYHNFFMGTRSHNTVYIDDEDQMLLWRRFKWLYRTKARLSSWEPEQSQMEGEHYGYKRLDKGLVHKRKVDWKSDNLIVIDSLSNSMKKYHKFSLHWQLNVQRLKFKRQNHVFFVCCENEENIYYLYFGGQIGGKIASTDLDIQRGFDNGGKVDGWISRYYGKKIPVYAANLNTNTNQPVRFVTIISKSPVSNEKVLECTSF
jgi:hypothetical protein